MAGLLANWMWQGCAVALAATVVLRASRRMSATTRYQLWWVTLAIVLLLPVASFQLPAIGAQRPVSSLPQEPWLPPSGGRSALGGDSRVLPPAGGSYGTNFFTSALAGIWQPAARRAVVLPAAPAWTGALLVFVWCAWASTSLARTVAALVTLARAKRSVRPFPEAREARLQAWLSLRARSRRTRLALSDHVRAAAVLGLTSPSIVVAPVALGALSDEELDQIVAHEWAHVHRRDDIARLVQRMIVAFAGLHPAVWWIDRQLHLERETACDDWAVNATGSARALAVSLTKLASLPGRPSDTVLLPAALASSELTTRVVRLLDRRRNTSTVRRVGAPMIVAPILGALALTVASVELVVTSPGVPDVSQRADAAAPASASPSDRRVPSSPELPAVSGASARGPRKVQAAARTSAIPRVQSLAPAYSPESVTTLLSSARDDDQQRVVSADGMVEERPLGTGNLPGTSTPVADVLPPPAVQPIAVAAPEADQGPTLWGAAADVGVTVGKGSQKAAVATAGFFTRLSKSISGVF